MNKILKRTGIAIMTGALLISGVAGCSEKEKARTEIQNKAENRAPFLPKNDVEFKNYNKAQELYDDPTAILWCTAFPNGGNSPVVTIPIAGKLTSSSSSYSNDELSVDGMFHGNPPPYRFGFTPGGQFVSFEGGINVICTTALTEFQKTKTFISVETTSPTDDAQTKAEAALKAGHPDEASQILKNATANEGTK